MAAYRPGKNAIINQAILFATIAHGNQVRKGNEHIPYMFHPIDVANEVIYYSGLPIEEMEQAAVVAILHDTVEDTHVTLRDIADQFGSHIADGVRAMSKDAKLGKHEGNDKSASLQENLERLKASPRWVQVVKLADRTSNLKSFPSFWSREKIECYLHEATITAEALKESSLGLYVRLMSRIQNASASLSLLS